MTIPNDCTARFTSIIPTTIDAMVAFHSDPGAFKVLTPFPIIVQMHRNELRSLTDGEVEFTLWFGPIPSRWVARHEPGPNEWSFADRMIRGPMQVWYHRHIFTPVEGGVQLTDCIQMEHKPGGFWGVFTRLFFTGVPLRFLFFYRHLRTRIGVKKYERRAAAQRG